MTAYWFGCDHERMPGHYLHDERMRLVRSTPLTVGLRLDQGFCPPKGVPEGAARITKIEDGVDPGPATVLAFWDRSGDSRPGSHSTFVLPGHLSYDEALEAAREAFPAVFARLDFEVYPWPRRDVEPPEEVEPPEDTLWAHEMADPPEDP